MEYEILSESAQEVDLIDELFVEGCWLETITPPNSHYFIPSLAPNQHMYQHESDATSFPFQIQSESFVVESTEAGKRWWIRPRGNPGPSSSVKERLVVALGHLKDVLIQIWVPMRGHHHHPYSGIDPNCNTTEHYRNVSRGFDQENSEDRIIVGKLQEWTPVVRFFRSHEYPRINFAHQYYDGRGSVALPVFERGTGTCLGVVEILITNQNINYRPQLDNVCHAFQAVDFRSCQNSIPIPPAVKVFDELYQAALNEIVEVLTSVVKTHNLPLALTWAPCFQQGKTGCGPNSNDQNQNYGCCVSTVDSACFVADLDILGFQEACCECHLFRGQGIVGTALTTTRPCFATDMTAFSKSQYPLAAHAAMYGLHAAVAIPLRNVYTGPAEFVLELFLPKDCHDTEQQKQMLNSLCMVVQQACRSLHVVMDMEFEQEFTFPSLEGGQQKEQVHNFASYSEDPSSKESSWIAHMMEAQQKGKGVSVSLEYLEEAKEEFKVTTNWDSSHRGSGSGRGSGQVFSDYEQFQQSCGSRGSVEVEGGGESYNFGGRRSSGGRKSGEKRRTKAEKTISLPVLRQYFAGSLKDAAKSIGVCPTTLKRICRQHGITRWPSRKIKKVGHSLRKLQRVIDSVQGAEGAIQIGSFYSSFPELSSGGGSCQTSKMGSNSNKCRQMHCSNRDGGTTLKSKSPRQTCYASGGGNIIEGDDTKNFSTYSKSPLPEGKGGGGFRVKATFGDEKIRFSLQQNWGFRDLQMEIARRFNLNEVTNIDLKYLDEDGEWVRLTCDADIEECKDIYTASQSHTIRLSLFQASPHTFGSSSSPSCS